MLKQKKALITGITGQDGSYLAELLLDKGYEVHGLVRRSSSFNTERIDHLIPRSREQERPGRLYREYGDLTDGLNLCSILKRIEPDEVYNLGAQSHVRISFEKPVYTASTVAMGTINLLEAIRAIGLIDTVKFYQASSSEMFGKVVETPQTEKTQFYPRSPYGVSKVFAYWSTVNYRESYNMFACNGILFNHESPRRGGNFVTKKIVSALVHIRRGLLDYLTLGNLDAKRDWGHAKDYVEAMWLMLQATEPDDYIIATGETHSVREFAEETARLLGFKLVWRGKDLEEKGIDSKTGNILIKIDPYFYRPAEVDFLIGDSSKAKQKLGWEPKYKFKDLVAHMVEEELKQK